MIDFIDFRRNRSVQISRVDSCKKKRDLKIEGEWDGRQICQDDIVVGIVGGKKAQAWVDRLANGLTINRLD